MSPCQACGRPADDERVPGLCLDCAVRIDADTEVMLEREHDWLGE